MVREYLKNKENVHFFSEYVLKPPMSIGLYQCSNGEIISYLSINDGVADCQSGSDESAMLGKLSHSLSVPLATNEISSPTAVWPFVVFFSGLSFSSN